MWVVELNVQPLKYRNARKIEKPMGGETSKEKARQ